MRSRPTWLLLACLGFLFAACAAEMPSSAPSDGWSSVQSLDEVAIRYRVTGSEHGDPTIVFVHGFGSDSSVFDAASAHMAQRLRVIAIDLPGHGRSGDNRKNWTMEAYGEDVRVVCDAEHVANAVLVGHSMGGPVILEAAQAMGGRVLALVPIDTFHDVDQHFSDTQIEQVVDLWRKDFAGAAEGMVRGSFHQPIRDPALVERVAAQVKALRPAIGIALLESMFRSDPTLALDATTLPVRCLNSAARPTQVAAGRKHDMRFDVRTVPNVGHYVMLEDPEAFQALLDAAVDELAR